MRPSARRRPLLAVIILPLVLVGLLVYSMVGSSADPKSERKLAPAFRLDVLEPGTPPLAVEPLVADGKLTLDELRGSPVVLNFWASWCEACQVETPQLEDTWRRAARTGVVFVGVDTADEAGAAREFVEDYGMTYPTVSDDDEAAYHRYGGHALPTTFFINANGEIVKQIVGVLDEAELAAGIRAARTGRSSPPH